ncbi:MAG: bifunctional YncE family protein/alkaline phosphatase family protein [Armatimonadetes bacterium]|nr:bifunctional YncE family protein/alkaline phosphatase family protein [Armatimonadota bacterium]
MLRRFASLPTFLLWLALSCVATLSPASAQKPKPKSAKPRPYLHAPSVNSYAKHDPEGMTILPEGKWLKPVGRAVPLAKWPHGMALLPDGKTVFVASEDAGQTVSGWDAPGVPEVKAFAPGLDEAGKKRKSAGGCAVSPDGGTLYWSGGENGAVYLFDTATRAFIAQVSLNGELSGRTFADSDAIDIALSKDGRYLYCADVTNFRVAVVDVATRKMIGSVDVGRYPYALAIMDTGAVYVANIGMFAYSPVGAPAEGSGFDKRGLTYPPYGVPSKEAEEGVDFEGRKIPGLGKPNVPESFSVWGLDVSDPASPRVIRKVKPGLAVGVKGDAGITVGGSGPNFLVAHGKSLYISDNNNDFVECLDTVTGKITRRVSLNPSPLTAGLRGVAPSGMAVSRDGSRLYVAQSGINAVAVIDTVRGRVIGQIPTAWYPYRVALSPDGKKLLTVCFRGFGNGPNGGKNIPKSPYLGMKGALCVADTPTDAALAPMTKNVLLYNGIVDATPDRAKMASPVVPTTLGTISKEIKYVVFITKENHTYDAIFDRIPGANDDPSLLRWGLKQTIAGKDQPTLTDVPVMTNHNALARQFTVSDNFYMQPEASGVGHRWLVGVMPNNWCQMTYTLGWDFKKDSTAPGRRASFGSNGSIAPEDYPEAGSMWEHLDRGGVGFRNYGEGFEFAGVGEDEDSGKSGAREVINMPMPKVLYDNTCRDFPIFNMNIPDQYRAYWFEQDFTKQFLSPNKVPEKPMPGFINIAICNDHGAAPKPDKGYPYAASWMADNDHALGRIVEFLSNTPYWKNMAIFVTQDDSGGEPDHVEAQRSVLMVISPWAKRGNVSHRHTTITSMHRTMYQIFGLPSLNMSDALVNDFSDCFTTVPDFTPYKCVGVDPRIFDPEKAKNPKDPDYKAARLLPSIARDNAEAEEEVLKLGTPPAP